MRRICRDIDQSIARRRKRFNQKTAQKSIYENLSIWLASMIALITGKGEGLAKVEQIYRTRASIAKRETGHLWIDSQMYPPHYGYIGLVAEAILNEDSALAQECYEGLKDESSQKLYPLYWFCDIRGRLLGLLKLTVGDVEAAIRYLEESYHFCKAEGLNPILATVCFDYARALLKSALDTDRSLIERLLEEGLSIATALGMKPVETRLVSLRGELRNKGEECEGTKSHFPAGLTAREVEVLRHVALGKTNQEIGRDLGISENTESNHIKHAFAKTGVTNRVALTSYAIRAGLAPEDSNI